MFPNVSIAWHGLRWQQLRLVHWNTAWEWRVIQSWVWFRLPCLCMWHTCQTQGGHVARISELLEIFGDIWRRGRKHRKHSGRFFNTDAQYVQYVQHPSGGHRSQVVELCRASTPEFQMVQLRCCRRLHALSATPWAPPRLWFDVNL